MQQPGSGKIKKPHKHAELCGFFVPDQNSLQLMINNNSSLPECQAKKRGSNAKSQANPSESSQHRLRKNFSPVSSCILSIVYLQGQWAPPQQSAKTSSLATTALCRKDAKSKGAGAYRSGKNLGKKENLFPLFLAEFTKKFSKGQ